MIGTGRLGTKLLREIRRVFGPLANQMMPHVGKALQDQMEKQVALGQGPEKVYLAASLVAYDLYDAFLQAAAEDREKNAPRPSATDEAWLRRQLEGLDETNREGRA